MQNVEGVVCDPARTALRATYPTSCRQERRLILRTCRRPGRAGASRDGWSGVRTGSPIGREGEPTDDIGMIGCLAKRAKIRLGLLLGPFVL